MQGLTHSTARIIFALPFAIFGIMHLMKAGDMAVYVPSFIPGGIIWVYVTGVAMLAAAIGLIVNFMGKWAGLGLALLLLSFILTIHIPAVMNPDTMQMAMPNLLKDLGLLGGALLASGASKA